MIILMNSEPGAGGGGVPAGNEPPPAPPAGNEPPPAPPAGNEPPPAPFYSSLPDDWRQQSVAALGFDAAELEKRTNQLNRITDYPSLLQSWFSAQDKIRQGMVSSGLPADATPEQLSAYREANGIPMEASGYKFENPMISETDREILNGVSAIAHKYNIPQKALEDIVNANMEGRKAALEKLEARDGVESQQATQILKQQWGADFERNRNIVDSMVNSLPESVREDFVGARLADGKALFNSPEMLHFFADMQRKVNPMATVIDINSANPVGDMDSEIKAIEAKMGTDAYFKDEKMQARYRQLISARDAMKKTG